MRSRSGRNHPARRGPARYLGTPDGHFNVGFITPISQHFCQTCNRIRVAVDGTAYMCLGQEEKFEFRPLLRGGCSDAALDAAFSSDQPQAGAP